MEKRLVEADKDVLQGKIKLIQISDYHNNNLIDKKRLVKTIKKLNPDLIVLTGDIIDSQTEDFDKTIELLSEIKKVSKNVYSVSGNHERANKKRDEYNKRIEDIGVYNLDDKYVTLDLGEDKINLCGLPFGKKREGREGIWDGLPEELFTILLAHSPKHAMENEEFKKNLILSGHIHGGQVRLPLLGAVVSPEDGFFPEYTKGLYDLEDSKLYIDSGLGNSVAPLRTFNRVQISHIEIN